MYKTSDELEVYKSESKLEREVGDSAANFMLYTGLLSSIVGAVAVMACLAEKNEPYWIDLTAWGMWGGGIGAMHYSHKLRNKEIQTEESA